MATNHHQVLQDPPVLPNDREGQEGEEEESGVEAVNMLRERSTPWQRCVVQWLSPKKHKGLLS